MAQRACRFSSGKDENEGEGKEGKRGPRLFKDCALVKTAYKHMVQTNQGIGGPNQHAYKPQNGERNNRRRRFPPTAREALLGARGQALQPIEEQGGAKGNAYQYLTEWQGMKSAEALTLLEKAGLKEKGPKTGAPPKGVKSYSYKTPRGARLDESASGGW